MLDARSSGTIAAGEWLVTTKYWLKCESISLDVELTPLSTLGSAKGCSIPLAPEESVAGTHARVMVDDQGRWLLVAIHSGFPIFNDHEQPVSSLLLSNDVAFRIGSNGFVCRLEEESALAAPEISGPGRGSEARHRAAIRPPRGVKSLQYFFAEKLYRVAVLGGRDSGKTCLFAALGMPRVPRADGATCTRILHLRAPQLEPWAKTPEDTAAEISFQTGKVLLDTGETVDGIHIPGAIDRLLQGNVPLATRSDKVDARLVFKLTSPGRLPAMLESVDYAGEFASPSMAAEEQAQRIHDILQDSHGLIVLAQVPLPGGDHDVDVVAIDQAAKTFALLHLGRAIPIAMVVNKWDRREEFDAAATSHAEQCRALREYVESDEGRHLKALADALRNTAGEENFTMLPASALGKCEIVDGIERPRQNLPLQSFGLEDPFLWLIDRVDALVALKHQQDTNDVAPLPWAVLWGREARRLRAVQTRLLRGDISNKEELPRVKRAGRKLAFKRFLAKCQLAVLAAAAVLVAEYLASGRQIHAAYSALNKDNRRPIHDMSEYDASHSAVAQFPPYVDLPKYRHCLLALRLGRGEVSDAIREAEKRQISYLNGVIDSANSDLRVRVHAADNLRENHPAEAKRREEVLAALDVLLADTLWSGLTNDTRSFQMRANDATCFITRYPNDRRAPDVRRWKENLQNALEIENAAEAALANVGEYSATNWWDKFSRALTGPKCCQLDPALRRQIITGFSKRIDGPLLLFLNGSIAKLTDPTRLRNNADLRALQDSRERFARLPEEAGKLLNRFDNATKLFQNAIRDRSLYNEAGHTNRDATERYLNEAGKSTIPGFMRSEASDFMAKSFDGQLVVDRIEWIGDGFVLTSRPKALVSIKDGGRVINAVDPITTDFVPGASIDVGTLLPIGHLAMNSEKDIAVEIKINVRGRNPILVATYKGYPDRFFKGVTIDARETKAARQRRWARVHLRLVHNHRLPEWTARRFSSLDSMAWQRENLPK